MKKIAIIGDSQAFQKDSYANIALQKYKDSCDIYAINDCDSSSTIFMLLLNKIINEYEYVIIQFNPADTEDVLLGYNNKETIISAYLYILKLFQGSLSTPLILLLPHHEKIWQSSSYIIRAIARITCITLIDVESCFATLSFNAMTIDGKHYRKKYQQRIFDEIEKSINCTHQKIKYPESNISYSLFNISKKCDIAYWHDFTDKIKLPVYELTDNNEIKLPDNNFLCGIMFWNKKNSVYLLYKNDYITLYKNLNIMSRYNIFFSRTIGYSIQQSLQGGVLKASKITHGACKEYTGRETAPEGEYPALQVSAILLCNCSPWQYGREFYDSHRHNFIKAKEGLIHKFMDANGLAIYSIAGRMNNLMPRGASFFKELVESRPDLPYELELTINSAPDEKDDYRAERLLLWSWIYGRHEVPFLKENEEGIKNALRRLNYELAMPNIKEPYSRLVHVIWSMRPDLAHFNPANSQGRKAIIDWFKKYGCSEFQVYDILRTC